MRRASFKELNCSVAAALEIVGERWSLLVVREAFLGARRFEEYQRHLGIARNILTTRLRGLVAAGVLGPLQYQERPARFEYRLTERGLALFPVIASLMAWGDRFAASQRGPPVLLVDRETRKALEPVLVDRRTGLPVDARHLRAVPGPGATEATRRRLLAREAEEGRLKASAPRR